jgi:hypothetical protein
MGARIGCAFTLPSTVTLRREEPSPLEVNKRYLVTIEDDSGDDNRQRQHVLTKLAEMAADLGVGDLAEHHDEYASRR